MELADALARRRMVRRYDPDRGVDADALDAVLAAALRAPSAGFTQGVSLLVLDTPDQRDRFWAASTGADAGAPAGTGTGTVAGTGTGTDAGTGTGTDAGTGADAHGASPSRWLTGMRTAPVLVLVLTSREAYLDRYAEPDKGWTDRDEGRWSAPYWFVDAGMAAMAMLLRAVDLGLGACFFGVPADRADAVRAALGVPGSQLAVGVVSLGHRPPDGGRGTRGSPSRRPRRGVDEVVHRGRW